MAGDWIKMEVGLASKPEVIRMGRILGLSPEAVCGWLLKFWGWIDANSVDGVVDGIVVADVDMAMSLPGLADALAAVKWLQFDAGKKCMILPKFNLHNGETAKKRGLASKRQATWRAKSVDGSSSTTELPEKNRVRGDGFAPPSALPIDASHTLPAKQKTTQATITTTHMNGTDGSKIWDAYADAYFQKYGTEPVRNAMVNGICAKLAKRLPTDEAPLVAAFYLTLPYYMPARHPVANLIRDCEGIRTQWATGVKATRLETRSAEHVDNMAAQIQRVGAQLEGKR